MKHWLPLSEKFPAVEVMDSIVGVAVVVKLLQNDEEHIA